MILSKLTTNQLETLALINYGFKSSTIKIMSHEESINLHTDRRKAYDQSKHEGLFVDALYFTTSTFADNPIPDYNIERHTKTLLSLIDSDNIYQNNILNYRFSKMYFERYTTGNRLIIDKYYPQPAELNVKKNKDLQKLYEAGLLFYIPLFTQSRYSEKTRDYSLIMMPVVHPKLNEYLQFDLLEDFLINDSKVDSELAMTLLKSQKLINDYNLDLELVDIFNYYKNTDLFKNLITIIKQRLYIILESNPVNTLLGLFCVTNIYQYVTEFLGIDYEIFKNDAITFLYKKAMNRRHSIIKRKLSNGLHVEEYFANILNNEQHRLIYGTDNKYFNNLTKHYAYPL